MLNKNQTYYLFTPLIRFDLGCKVWWDQFAKTYRLHLSVFSPSLLIDPDWNDYFPKHFRDTCVITAGIRIYRTSYMQYITPEFSV